MDVAAGEEIFLNYGQKSNSQLFLTYGFTLEEENDAWHGVLSTNINSWPLGPLLGPTLFSEIYTPDEVGQLSREVSLRSNSFPQFVASLLRAHSLQFSDVTLEGLSRLKNGQAVSLKNEAKALRLLMLQCARELSAYPTTIDEDAELLKQENLSDRHRMAVQIRLGEKKALRGLMGNVNNMWNAVLLTGKLSSDPTLVINA